MPFILAYLKKVMNNINIKVIPLWNLVITVKEVADYKHGYRQS